MVFSSWVDMGVPPSNVSWGGVAWHAAVMPGVYAWKSKGTRSESTYDPFQLERALRDAINAENEYSSLQTLEITGFAGFLHRSGNSHE